jgi:Flp pilus assembly protein TadB
VSAVSVGALAATLAITCLLLVPLGSRGALSFAHHHPEAGVLSEAGWTRSGAEWEALRFCATLAAIWLASLFGVAPLGLVGAILPSLAARARAGRGRDERARQAVVLLQTTVAAMRSGVSLTESVRVALSSGNDAALDPVVRAMRAFDLGAPLDAALRDARTDVRDPRVLLTLDALALCVSEQMPASRCITVITSAVDRLLFEQRTSDEVRARTAGLRVQIVLLAVLVPALALYLAVTVPGMRETLATPVGRFVLLPVAGLLETVGILTSRHILSHIE